VLRLLEANGIRCELPTFFIWEGNTMYLTQAAAMKLLAELKERLRAFGLSFDYMSEEVLPTRPAIDKFRASSSASRQWARPWHFGINDLEALAAEAALTVVDGITTGELHRAYWSSQPLDSIIYQHYSLCTLRHDA
jgi:O-methyltransferase involved in polyketide biosynthesis